MNLSKREGSHFREMDGSLELIGTVSSRAARPRFPPADYSLGGVQNEDVSLGSRGTLYTYTIVHPGKDRAPYGLAMVDFPGQVRVFGRLLIDVESTVVLESSVKVVPWEFPDGIKDYAFALV
ncbi:Zn-ribbon domain-containing OB-fold protein [Paraburkholderia aspalathi]|uniref:Zn-ribbon domain-containing OB-fold protein n=1 Tax=Paraburkholderia aspalathi TaxID=1324617 RepID=UPI0038BA8182